MTADVSTFVSHVTSSRVPIPVHSYSASAISSLSRDCLIVLVVIVPGKHPSVTVSTFTYSSESREDGFSRDIWEEENSRRNASSESESLD